MVPFEEDNVTEFQVIHLQRPKTNIFLNFDYLIQKKKNVYKQSLMLLMTYLAEISKVYQYSGASEVGNVNVYYVCK